MNAEPLPTAADQAAAEAGVEGRPEGFHSALVEATELTLSTGGRDGMARRGWWAPIAAAGYSRDGCLGWTECQSQGVSCRGVMTGRVAIVSLWR